MCLGTYRILCCFFFFHCFKDLFSPSSSSHSYFEKLAAVLIFTLSALIDLFFSLWCAGVWFSSYLFFLVLLSALSLRFVIFHKIYIFSVFISSNRVSFFLLFLSPPFLRLQIHMHNTFAHVLQVTYALLFFLSLNFRLVIFYWNLVTLSSAKSSLRLNSSDELLISDSLFYCFRIRFFSLYNKIKCILFNVTIVLVCLGCYSKIT